MTTSIRFYDDDLRLYFDYDGDGIVTGMWYHDADDEEVYLPDAIADIVYAHHAQMFDTAIAEHRAGERERAIEERADDLYHSK